MMASSSSDMACLLGCPRSDFEEVNADRVGGMFKKTVLMTLSPQSRLLEIITEALDLVNDDNEDHHFADNVSSC